MYKKTYDEPIKITPEQAAEFISLTYDGQRDISQLVVDEYRQKMIDGIFLDGNIAIASLNGNRMLINGQHQCWAFVESGLKKFPAQLRKYKCETLGDVALLYRQFDTHRGRNIPECVSMEAKALGVEWPRKVLLAIVSAAATLEYGQGKRITKEVRCKLLQSYLNEGDFVVNMLAPNGKLPNEYLFLAKGPVVAEMITTWRKCHSAAEGFWGGIKDRDGLRKNDPRQTIAEFLLRTVVKSGYAASYRTAAHPIEIRTKIRMAWNAYREGRTISKLQYKLGRRMPPVK